MTTNPATYGDTRTAADREVAEELDHAKAARDDVRWNAVMDRLHG